MRVELTNRGIIEIEWVLTAKTKVMPAVTRLMAIYQRAADFCRPCHGTFVAALSSRWSAYMRDAVRNQCREQKLSHTPERRPASMRELLPTNRLTNDNYARLRTRRMASRISH